MIETVLGAIPAAALGPMSMHDHAISDCRLLCRPVAGPVPSTSLVSEANRDYVREHALASRDNLLLEDVSLACSELDEARRLGLAGYVDLTSWGGDMHYTHLPEIARRTGLHIVASYGIYLDRPHPPWVARSTDDELAQRFRNALDDHLPGVTFRAGILGIIGTSAPVTAGEARVVKIAGQVAAERRVSVVVRLDPNALEGEAMLGRLSAAGCPAHRVIFPNCDELIGDGDRAHLDRLAWLAEQGATLEFCFGNVFRLRDGFPRHLDEARLDAVTRLLDRGLARQLVLGQSVFMKIQLRRHGGEGYGHLMRTIVPVLRARGVADEEIEQMLVLNPRRLLERPGDDAY